MRKKVLLGDGEPLRATRSNGRNSPAPKPPAPPEHLHFRAVRTARAFDDIAEQFRSELAAGHLKVGSRLPAERALAEQFGVSRNTLREALRSLEYAGVIRLMKGASGGAYVCEHKGESIMSGLMDMYHLGTIQPAHLTQARIWLESIVVREACKKATAADLRALNQNIKEAEDALQLDDFVRRTEVNLEFHRILTRIVGNPIMVPVMNGVLDILHEYVKKIGRHDNSFVLKSRRRFMKHFAAGDADAAVLEMEATLLRLHRNYLSMAEAKDAPPSR